MRAVFLVLIVVIVAAIIAFATGMVGIRQTQQAQLPGVTRTGTTVTAHGGQPPAFEVETGSVGVGSTQANVAVPAVKIEKGQTQVRVPTIEVSRPGAATAPATNQVAR